MEKEKFQMPEMEVIAIEAGDVIVTSVGNNETQVVPMTGSGSNG